MRKSGYDNPRTKHKRLQSTRKHGNLITAFRKEKRKKSTRPNLSQPTSATQSLLFFSSDTCHPSGSLPSLLAETPDSWAQNPAIRVNCCDPVQWWLHSHSIQTPWYMRAQFVPLPRECVTTPTRSLNQLSWNCNIDGLTSGLINTLPLTNRSRTWAHATAAVSEARTVRVALFDGPAPNSSSLVSTRLRFPNILLCSRTGPGSVAASEDIPVSISTSGTAWIGWPRFYQHKRELWSWADKLTFRGFFPEPRCMSPGPNQLSSRSMKPPALPWSPFIWPASRGWSGGVWWIEDLIKRRFEAGNFIECFLLEYFSCPWTVSSCWSVVLSQYCCRWVWTLLG